MNIAICERCGARMTSRAFNTHACKGKRKLKEMNTLALTRFARREITEEEAWELSDAMGGSDEARPS
jgi:hypothetical protein